MKKQGPPATLEELGISLKRKPQTENEPAAKKKRRRSAEVEEEEEPTKLVKLDRAMRQEREEKEEVKRNVKQKKRERLVDQDKQITVPPMMVMEEDDEEMVDEVEPEDEPKGLDQMMLDEFAEDGSEQSVFDSDQEVLAQKMFSEDEDESEAEAMLTAANIEGLSRKLDQEQEEVDAEAQQELEDAAIQTNIAADSDLLDSAQSGPGLAPDLQLIRSRMTETIRILELLVAGGSR